MKSKKIGKNFRRLVHMKEIFNFYFNFLLSKHEGEILKF